MIRVTMVKERRDGSGVMEFTYDRTFAEKVKNIYGKKRATRKSIKKLLKKFIKEALDNKINEESKTNIKDLELGVK